MTKEDQKKRERYFLERFLAASGFHATSIVAGEAPDFSAAVDGREIGFEVTELFAPTVPGQVSLQALESRRARIVSSAMKRYTLMGGSPVHLSVLFSANDSQRDRRDTIAAALANLVLAHSPLQGQHKQWRNSGLDEPAAISVLNMLGVPERKFAHWSAAAAGWQFPLTADLIQAAVSDKNSKVSRYRQRFGELWLILAVEGSKPSQFLDMTALPRPSAINSLFDRTYLVSTFTNELVRLGHPT